MNTAEVPLRRLVERCLTEIAKLKGRVGDLEADFYEDEFDEDDTDGATAQRATAGPKHIPKLDLASLPTPSQADIDHYLAGMDE